MLELVSHICKTLFNSIFRLAFICTLSSIFQNRPGNLGSSNHFFLEKYWVLRVFVVQICIDVIVISNLYFLLYSDKFVIKETLCLFDLLFNPMLKPRPFAYLIVDFPRLSCGHWKGWTKKQSEGESVGERREKREGSEGSVGCGPFFNFFFNSNIKINYGWLWNMYHVLRIAIGIAKMLP